MDISEILTAARTEWIDTHLNAGQKRRLVNNGIEIPTTDEKTLTVAHELGVKWGDLKRHLKNRVTQEDGSNIIAELFPQYRGHELELAEYLKWFNSQCCHLISCSPLQ